MRCFEHIAVFIRTKRIGHPNKYSQLELSRLLGYKSGSLLAMWSGPLWYSSQNVKKSF